MKNSMIYLRQWLAVCALIVSFAACNNDDNDTSGGNVTLVSPTEGIQCLAAQSKQEITFSATGDWVAVPSNGWLKLNQIQGVAGEQTLELTIAENKTFKERTGAITLKDKQSGKSIDVAVKQGAMGEHFVFEEGKEEQTELVIDSENRAILASVRITSNYDWKVSVPVEFSWLTYKEVEANGDTRKLMFYADPAKIQGYSAIDAKISFDYVAETRAPGNTNYKVRFPGITPKVEVTIDNTESTEMAELADPWGEGAYKAGITVTSNVAWDFGKVPNFVEAKVNDGNSSARFFEVQSRVFLTLKDDKLDTDKLDGSLTFLDAANKEAIMKTLTVHFAGVGSNFVSFDSSVFQSTDPMGTGFMFDAAPVWDDQGNSSLEKTITVKASNKEDIAIYVAKANSAWGPAMQQEVWYAGADAAADSRTTRSAVKGYKYTVWASDRTWDMGDKSSDRYFALFVVSKKKAPTFDDLFDTDGYVKEEFMSANNYKILGQKGIEVHYTFWSEQVSEGQTLEFPAKGATLTIHYESDAQYIEFFSKAQRYQGGGDYNWGGERVGADDPMLAADITEAGTSLKLIIKPNTTGEVRTENCAFGAYVEGKENDQLLILFHVKQAAN